MCQLETDDESKAEAGNTDQSITYYVYHLSFPLISGLPAELIDDRNYCSGIETLLGDFHEPLLIVH